LSLGVTIVIAIVYFLLNKITWLDNLGRKTRSRSDTKIGKLRACTNSFLQATTNVFL